MNLLKEMSILNSRQYYTERILPNISKEPIVLTGISAMCYLGMSVAEVYIPDVLTNHKELENMRLANYVNYCYVPKVDYNNYTTVFNNNPNILLPTRERVIVENIVNNFRFIDEGYFLDTLERYINSSMYNKELLENVSLYFNLGIDTLNYWINESLDYNSF